MNEEKQLTEIESLSIIQKMIETAKTEQKDNGMGWIVWGWMLFTASVLTLLNMRFDWFDQTFVFWNLFGGVAVIIMVVNQVRSRFSARTQTVRTYTGDLFRKLNAGFFISLGVIILALNVGATVVWNATRSMEAANVIVNIGFALLINLYAFWILIYGAALNFKPSIIGAYVAFALGIASILIHEFEWVMILHSIAILVGYIIPGHLANNAFKKLKSRHSA